MVSKRAGSLIYMYMYVNFHVCMVYSSNKRNLSILNHLVCCKPSFICERAKALIYLSWSGVAWRRFETRWRQIFSFWISLPVPVPVPTAHLNHANEIKHNRSLILLRPVFVHLRRFYPQRFEPTCILTIVEFYNAYIICLLNHTKIEYISFQQESYATKHYCWVNHFKSTIFCQVFVRPKLNLICPTHWLSPSTPFTGGLFLFI